MTHEATRLAEEAKRLADCALQAFMREGPSQAFDDAIKDRNSAIDALAALAQPAPTAEVALPAVSEEAERVAFEAWSKSQNWFCSRNSFGEYTYETVRDGWSAWLARAQSAAKGGEGGSQ